jgi:hypothetical protein
MKRIFVPTKTGTDWQPLLAKQLLHWKSGASAMTAAACWEAAGDSLPPEIAILLESSGDPLLVGQRLLAAMPEWQVQLPGGLTTSNTDVLAVCRNDHGLCVLGVEAKVFEAFGPLISEKRAEPSAGQLERLAYLHSLLGIERLDDSIRYQLLHRTASSLLTAREFHAAAAVMLVHAFDTPATQRRDFEAFHTALRAQQVGSMLYRVPEPDHPALYVGWCDGDPKFRRVVLPSAL